MPHSVFPDTIFKVRERYLLDERVSSSSTSLFSINSDCGQTYQTYHEKKVNTTVWVTSFRSSFKLQCYGSTEYQEKNKRVHSDKESVTVDHCLMNNPKFKNINGLQHQYAGMIKDYRLICSESTARPNKKVNVYYCCQCCEPSIIIY